MAKRGGLAVYPIGSVMRQTGLTGRQIRYYEQMNLIEPTRSKGNQRLYSDMDVERLVRIKKLLDDGYNIEGIRALLEGGSKDDAPERMTASTGSGNVVSHSIEDDGEQDDDDEGLDSPLDMESALPEVSAPLLRGAKLISLYPVNNGARLQNLLLSKHGRSEQD